MAACASAVGTQRVSQSAKRGARQSAQAVGNQRSLARKTSQHPRPSQMANFPIALDRDFAADLVTDPFESAVAAAAGADGQMAAQNAGPAPSRSRCELQLAMALYHPPVCQPEYFTALAAQLKYQAIASQYIFSYDFCDVFSKQFNVNVEILDALGVPLCLNGPDIHVDDVWMDRFYLVFLSLAQMSPVNRAIAYSDVFALATGVGAPAGLFDPASLSDIIGIFTILSYLAQATTDAQLQVLFQNVSEILVLLPQGSFQNQPDLDFFLLLPMYISYRPAASYYSAIYTPILSWYSQSLAADPSNPGVEAAGFFFTLADVFVSTPYYTAGSANPELNQRYQQYPVILRYVLNPSALIYSFAPLNPLTLTARSFCFYGTTMRSEDANAFRVVLSSRRLFESQCK